MDYREPMVRIVGGEPAFTGTRVTLRTVLGSLAKGPTMIEVLGDFSTLSEADVATAMTACLHYRDGGPSR